MLWVTILIIIAMFAGLGYFSVGAVPGKTLAVAQAAYRESIRQSLFWFLLVIFAFFMFLAMFLQYFTFGEDIKMMKDIQLDAVLLPTLLLTVFTASISISEEIEGRTAITLLSKPISRRQFLLGKYIGILMAAVLLGMILMLLMGWTIHYKWSLDRILDERPADPDEIVMMQDALSAVPGVIVGAIRAVLLIFVEIQTLLPGLVMIFCQVAVISAVAVALATRLPMVVNLVVCLVFFFMGRLTHVLEAKSGDNPLISFVAQVFGTLLPGLHYYDVGPALVADVEVPAEYIFSAMTHGAIYTAIALLVGLILFEDRDLA